MKGFVASIDPNDPDWIRWTSLREDLRHDAHERDVEHAVFVLSRVIQQRYPDAVMEAGLSPEAVLEQLDLSGAERARVVERLHRETTVDDPLAALPTSVREALVPPEDQDTSG